MKIQPELEQNESILCTVEGQLDRVGGSAILSVTSDRIIVGEKKGKSLTESLSEIDDSTSTTNSTVDNFDVQLDEIQKLRRSGWASKELEVEANGKIVQLPTLDSKSSEKVVEINH